MTHQNRRNTSNIIPNKLIEFLLVEDSFNMSQGNNIKHTEIQGNSHQNQIDCISCYRKCKHSTFSVPHESCQGDQPIYLHNIESSLQWLGCLVHSCVKSESGDDNQVDSTVLWWLSLVMAAVWQCTSRARIGQLEESGFQS